MKEQLIETWRTSNGMSLLFIDNIDKEGMQKTLSPRGGRTVYQQFVHVHNVRLDWLEAIDKEIFMKYNRIAKDTLYDGGLLHKSFVESGKAIEEFIYKSWEKEGKVKSFKKGLIPFIGYLIAHDAHHRGHAILTLKQCGVKIPDQVKWGIWEWDK